MNEKSRPPVADGVLVIRRRFAVSRHRLFQAWVDQKDMARWYTEQELGQADISDFDLSVGGGYVAKFGPKTESPWIERVQYRELVPPRNIRLLTSMTKDAAFVGMTEVDITINDLAEGSELVLTETGVEPASLNDRNGGWSRTLDNLARHLAP